jgi:hypothetical protein
MSRIALLFGLLFSQIAFSSPRLEQTINSALGYLQASQSDGHDGYDVGQWSVQVTSSLPNPIGLGKRGVPYDDPTAFVAASVANVLAEIYFLDPRWREIPSEIQKTLMGFEPYRAGDVFNFYPLELYKGQLVRGPRFFPLKRWFEGFTHIPPDADTTSVAFLTMAYSEALQKGGRPQPASFRLAPAVLASFTGFRDVGRLPHPYNAVHNDVNTGAYLTWFFDEKDPAMPRNPLAPPDRGPRIPFNVNDVDCVVNGNVLKLLTVAGEMQAPGYAETCSHLNRIVRLERFYNCGMYYASQWNLPYVIATALENGAVCLEPSREKLVEFILRKQRSDGSWRNRHFARSDFVQSTAWALSALLTLGDAKNPLHRERAQRAVDFLHNQMRLDPMENVYWEGEVFFSATYLARYPVVWRSTAYTTAIVTKALVKADRFWGIQ